MMNARELFTMERSLRNRLVLSVYLSGVDGDPGDTDAWRIRLKGALATVQKQLATASHTERESFARIEAAVSERAGAGVQAGGHGWLAFATEDGVHVAEPVRADLPTIAVWQMGAFIAPYLRLLPFSEPVLAVIVDRETARVFRQKGDMLEALDTLRPTSHPGPEPRARSSHLGKTHSGTRGATGADDLSRVRRAEQHELVRQLAAHVAVLAGKETPVIVGGAPMIALMAMAALQPQLGARAVHAEHLTDAATPAEITAAARALAPSAFVLAHPAIIDELVELAGAHGRAVIGPSDAITALREGRARELVIARAFTERHPSSADLAIKAAIDSRVTVVELSGPEGEKLDALGGIGARLRYVQPAAVAAAGAVTSG